MFYFILLVLFKTLQDSAYLKDGKRLLAGEGKKERGKDEERKPDAPFFFLEYLYGLWLWDEGPYAPVVLSPSSWNYPI